MITKQGVRFAGAVAVAAAVSAGCVELEAEGGELASTEQAVLQPGYTVVLAETAVGTAGFRQLIVDCPAGKVALGAGFAVLDSTSAILDGVATYSAPRWDGSGWMVNARNLSAWQPSWKLRVQVVCADPPSGYDVAFTDTAFDSASSKQLDLHCAAGKKVTGAGFGVLDSTAAIMDGEATYFLPSFDGSGWLMNARETTGSASWKLRGFSICADATAFTAYHVATATSALDKSAKKQVSVTCPKERVATGAGWAVLDSTDGILDGGGLHHAPSWAGTSWLTNAENHSAWSPSWKLRTRALCVR